MHHHLKLGNETMSVKIVDTNLDNILEYGVCGYKNIKNEGLKRKIE